MDFHGGRIVDGWENPYLIATLATQHGFCLCARLLCQLTGEKCLFIRSSPPFRDFSRIALRLAVRFPLLRMKLILGRIFLWDLCSRKLNVIKLLFSWGKTSIKIKAGTSVLRNSFCRKNWKLLKSFKLQISKRRLACCWLRNYAKSSRQGWSSTGFAF